MLLSDGTVIFLGLPCSRLTPDIHGSYVNGTWTTLAPMHNTRTFYSSQVLPDGRVFACGGEYGTGKNLAEIYDPLSNVWTQESNPPDTVIDNISETLPNGNILEGSPGSDVRIFDIVSNTWSAPITSLGGFDEAPWAKLQDGSILGFSGTNSERFIPALNQWVADGNLPAPLYGPGYETGFGAQLPNGKVVFFGGTGSNAVYTPWTTNYNGIYTPNGTTNAGTWTLVASTPNYNAAIDAPAAMMVNGKILCCMTSTNTGLGSTSRFYEYDYVTNAFTAINGPEGGLIANQIAYGTEMLDLPDGTVLVSGASSGLYVYQPGSSPLTNGMPTIISATTNLDGSFHLTGTLFNGISEGAGYGDDWQMSSDYPIARMTNSAGNTLYARTFNWSTCNLMTGTNLVTTEMTLPPGMLAGTYPLVVSANGISSAAYSLTINGTPLPAVAGLGFSAIVSNKMAFHWNAIGLTETGYVIKRSTDGTNYSAVATLSSGTTNYTDSAVTPLGQYYYLVLGTNSVGLGNAAPAIFAASPPVVALPAPWQNRDIGFMQGSGAAGTNGGTFTVIGAGGGMGADNDQFQFVYQPMIGDVTITARVVANQNTGSNAMAGVMIRNSLGFDVADSLMVFDGGAQTSIFEHRDDAAALATYGLKTYGLPDNEDAPSGGGGNGSSTLVSQPASAPLWVRLVRSGNAITGYTSTDGSTWTAQGTNLDVFAPVVEVGLAVTSGTYNQLNTSTFDNVTVAGTAASLPPPMAEWKLDETGGTTAEDSIDSFDGLCNNVVLGLPGATPATGNAAGFNGTNANISIPALNLNSNILTITAWVNPNGAQNPYSAIFFNRANTTVSGFHFGVTNELRYTWNNSSGTYSASSGLVPPAGVWTFVALVIEPTRARIYMATNGGALLSWTNNVANAVQAFDGTSYIGQDPTGGRFFNGQLDEVQFFNQALAPAQLAQMAAPPVPAVTAPANGATFPAFASVNLSVSLSATNGHTLNSVEYFADNGQLLGQSATPPYSAATTNLNIGQYAVFARLFYDSGYSVDSALNSVVITVQPAVTNTWDANGALTGAQDGNGTWDGSTANWWNGSADVAWADFNFAVFGSGASTNCTVTLATDVTPYAITFNAGTGGYTIAGTNSIWLNVPGLPLNITANGNGTISVPLQGDNSLVKLGAGKLTLTASNSYAGETIVAAGMLKLGTNTAFGSDIVVTNPGTLDLNGQDVTASMFGNPVIISGAGAGGTVITNSSSATRGQLQDVVLSDNATIAGANTIFMGGTNAQNGVLNLNGFTLTKAGSGTLVLNGLNLTGPGNLTVNAGTLQLMDNYGNNQQNTVLAGSGTLTINPGASVMTYKWGATLTVSMPVVMNGGTLGSGWPGPNGATYACPITVSNNSTLNFNGGYDNCTLSGNITGSAGLNIIGGSGTRIFTGTNSYGWTAIGAGILKIGNGGATGTLGLGPVTNNATLTFSHTNSLTVSNLIAGSGALVQSGPGTLTLSGANTYAGTTTVGGGTLLVNGSLATNTVTVQTNATLGGTGTIAGSVLVTNAATLVPGTGSPGILAINGSLVLASGSTSNFRLNKGGTSDQVAGLAGAVYGGTLNVTSIGATLAAGDSFTLFNATGYSGGFAGLNLPALSAGLVWDTSKLMVNGTIGVAALPAVAVSPVSTNITYGGSATFAANATGTAPLAYQWYGPGQSLISGATNSTLTLAMPTLAANGSYTVVVNNPFGSATNSAALTVMPATLTVSANNTNRIYGAVNPAFTASYTGFVNGDTMAVLSGLPSLTATATTTSAAGNYSIAAGLGSLAATNYSFAFNNGTLTVSPATLTVSANNTNRLYGAANPTFTASYTGFVNGDTVAVLSGAPSLTASASASSAVGTYTIAAAVGSLTATNYSFGFANGTLTVNSAALTITANNTNKVYGQSLGFAGNEFAASGLLNSDTVTNVTLASTGTTNTAAAGSYTITAAAAQGTGLGNYTISYVSGTLTVNTAALTITANSTNKLYGQTLVFAGTEFTSSGLLNSDTVTNVALASTGATNTAGAGTYPITAAAAQGTGLANYAINYASGTLTVTGSLPTAPQNLIAQAIATNQISLTWSAVTNTTGYVVSRGGSAVANVAGTNYTDTGLAMGTPYVYTVTATNAIGSSPASAPAYATTPVLGTTLTWDTGTSTNAQDGSGVWSSNFTTWLYGTNNLGWYDGNVAAFGVDTTTNCTVTLTNDVTPAGITFNATGGGSYTITGTNNIWLANSPAFVMYGSGTLSTPVNGSGSLTENGGGTLTLTTHNGYSGGTIVNAGKLVSTVSCWYTPRGIGSGLLTVNSGATAEFTATHGFGGDASGRPAVINNGTLQFDHENYVSSLAMTGGGITGAGEIRTIATTYYIYGTTTNSLIGCNINMVNASTFSVTNGSSAVGLLVSGTVYGAGGLTKAGPGLLQLTGTDTSSGATTISAGTLQLDGSLGTNTVTVQSAATLSGTGTINGATTVQSGGTLAPGDNAIGTLTISNALTLAGNAAFALNKSGSTLTGDLVQGLGTVTYGGTLTVTATGSALAAGDSFTLFAATGYAGSFSTITLPTLGSGLAWDTGNLAVNGTIAVAALPFITTQPANQSVTQGSPATFSVTATGTALNYQWQKNGASIGGATASSYTISSTTTNDAASYGVVIANAVGSTNSATATLTVNVPPGITTQPVSQNINQGSPVTFSVTATGTAPLTYQWLKNGTNISGATSASYTISSVTATDAANYTVAVANVAGSTNSSTATLTVNVPPTITTQPASQTVIVGNPVTFTVAATGTAPLSYQWQKNGANISGATATSYTIGSVGTNDAANYTAIVTNIAGSVTSSTATLTVNAPFGDWHFDDGTGTVATDSAAVPHNGTVSGTNATWVTGLKGNALQFTGVSNYVAFGTGPSMSGTNNFTIAAWIKTTSTNLGVIMQQRDAANYNGEYRLSINGAGTVEFMLYGDGAYQFDFTTTNVLNNGVWHYVVAERNGLAGNIYLDGNPTPVATATGTGIKNLTNIINVAVGRDIRDNTGNFTGTIDEVKLYKVALSGADVAGLYNTYLGLVSPWLTADLGSGITTGSATQTNGVFTVQGAGNLSGTADNFRFVYQNMSGDAEIRARIPSYQNTGASGRLGVMMRDSLTANSMNAFMGIQVTNGTFYFQTRTSSGGATTSTSSGTGTAPNIWVRLVRSGTTLSGYKSSDGATWTLVSTNTFTMSTNCYFGLSVASGTTNTLNTATFDNLTVSP